MGEYDITEGEAAGTGNNLSGTIFFLVAGIIIQSAQKALCNTPAQFQ
jgi:hypothetical protein